MDPELLRLLLTWLATTASLLIVSSLPLGVEIDSFQKALLSAAVFGVLNAFLTPILQLLALPITILTLGIFALIVNAIVFGLAAWLVEGFRLRWGIWSALLGSIALSIINSIIFNIARVPR
ncbi:phage holin family protein [Microseira sp. BLCC-F43]|jgi:putative membrane protein|uniref:phage holin family protein n=1 Tax=Microseira sp. BLCC-F43 TaxID=3153602 RepID=UPI0035BA48A3